MNKWLLSSPRSDQLLTSTPGTGHGCSLSQLQPWTTIHLQPQTHSLSNARSSQATNTRLAATTAYFTAKTEGLSTFKLPSLQPLLWDAGGTCYHARRHDFSAGPGLCWCGAWAITHPGSLGLTLKLAEMVPSLEGVLPYPYWTQPWNTEQFLAIKDLGWATSTMCQDKNQSPCLSFWLQMECRRMPVGK